MRVSPQMSQIILAALNTSDQAEQTALQQLTTGRRVNQASDDPAAAAQEVSISSQLNACDQYTRSISSITSELQTADSSLNSAVTALQQAISLGTEGANGTLSQQNRNAIAQQVNDVSQLVLGVANLSYNGVYVFAGTADSQPPYVVDSSGNVQYQGNDGVNYVEIASGQSVPVNQPGSQLFSASGANVFTALSDLANALQDPNSTSQDIGNAVTELRGAYDQLTSARTFYGSTVDQLQSTQDFLNDENVQLSQQQNSTIGVDMNVAVTNLTQAEQARAATVEAAASMNNITLMDYLSNIGQ
ncbi:MAG TPA: flagellar hook-associated protein FlgL [Terriglobales bacterium]|nr:flagellar hook-associated protein FlgL [Terriglobales bacterium]